MPGTRTRGEAGHAGGGGAPPGHAAAPNAASGGARMGSIPSPFQQMLDVPFKGAAAAEGGLAARQRSSSSASSSAIGVGLEGLPAVGSHQREAMELLRQLEQVLQPRHSTAAKLQDVLQATEQLSLELQMVEEEGVDTTWIERRERVRQLAELQQRREKLSTAADYGGMVQASASDIAMLRALMPNIDEVSCDLGRLLRDSGASLGAALRSLVRPNGRNSPSSALELAQRLLDVTCAEMRCRRRDQHAASALGLRLFTAEQMRHMAAGAYDIVDGAIVAGRGLQTHIIQHELCQKGLTFHGTSDLCRDLQDMWHSCSELVAGTDEPSSVPCQLGRLCVLDAEHLLTFTPGDI
eukprot:jgi/Tetstr1/421385/TSEL_012353.t1